MKCFIVLVLYLACAYSAHLPPTVHTCKRTMPDFSECLAKNAVLAIQAFANGDKGLGLIPLEPLQVKEMRAVTHGKVQVEEIYRDVHIYGLTHSDVLKLTMDFDKCKLFILSYSPSINVQSNYELKGEISVFKLNGKGKSNQTINGFKMEHDMTCEKFEKDNKEYIRIVDYKTKFLEYDLHLSFENLLPGQPELSEELDKVLDENANSVFDETKINYQKTYAEVFKQLANVIFTKVPLDEIFPK